MSYIQFGWEYGFVTCQLLVSSRGGIPYTFISHRLTSIFSLLWGDFSGFLVRIFENLCVRFVPRKYSSVAKLPGIYSVGY